MRAPRPDTNKPNSGAGLSRTPDQCCRRLPHRIYRWAGMLLHPRQGHSAHPAIPTKWAVQRCHPCQWRHRRFCRFDPAPKALPPRSSYRSWAPHKRRSSHPRLFWRLTTETPVQSPTHLHRSQARLRRLQTQSPGACYRRHQRSDLPRNKRCTAHRKSLALAERPGLVYSPHPAHSGPFLSLQ